MNVHCSSILYQTSFNPIYDFTVSLNYKYDTQNMGSSQNNGFGIFFSTGNIFFLEGGGPGPGLGMVDTTAVPPAFCVAGLYFSIGFDRIGDFCVQGAPPYFTTGLPSATPNSITVRKNYSNVDFLSCVIPTNNIIFQEDTDITLRLGVRKMFGEVNVDVLSGGVFINIAKINTLIHPDSLPTSLKFGVSYSGDTYFTVKDICTNFTAST